MQMQKTKNMNLEKIYSIAKNTHTFEEFKAIIDEKMTGTPTTVVSKNEFELKQVKNNVVDDVSNQREFLLTFAQEWNWANDIADSPVIPDGFVDDFLNQIKNKTK